MIKNIEFSKAQYAQSWNKLVSDDELKQYSAAELLHLAAACLNGVAHAALSDPSTQEKHMEQQEADVATLYEEVFRFVEQFVELGGLIHAGCYDDMCEPQVALGINRTDDATRVVATGGMRRGWSKEFEKRMREAGWRKGEL
jgi:hypothetical protein